MRAIFVFVLFTGILVSHSQSIEDLRPKKISKNSNLTFVLIKNTPTDIPLIRRIDKNTVVVKLASLGDKYSYSEVYEINDLWKLSNKKNYKKSKIFYISTEKSLIGVQGLTEIYFDDRRNISLVKTNSRIIDRKVLGLSYVTYIQPADRTPKEESILRKHNLGINGIRSGQQMLDEYLIARNVSVKEGAFNILDIDIADKVTLDNLSSPQVTSHATDMATLIGGGGNTSVNGQGVASRVSLFSENFDNLLPASNSNFNQRNVSIQNHSYGVGIENFYGIESVAFDQQGLELPELLHVFSSGNSGSLNSTGDYSHIVQYRTITGSFKQAKNVLVVTGTDDLGNIPDMHSAGPAYDGRLKPELAAYGGEGTSDAAALVSGAAVTIASALENQTETRPAADLIKAILISSAVDIGAEGPDFKTGFGQMNLRRALALLEDDNHLIGELNAGSLQQTHTIQVPSNVAEIRVALVWRDPSANNGDFMALVNDLNLRVNGDGQEWMPLVLDHRPNLVNLESLAIQRNDTLNNVELIILKNPTAGSYDLNVSIEDLDEVQSYSIAYFFTYQDSLQWDYPAKEDPLLAAAENNIYFTHSFDETGILEIDYLDDNWQAVGAIGSNDFTSAFTTGNVVSEAVLRATFGLKEFKSDTFAIHPKVEMEVELLCDEELVISWNAITENQTYELLAFDGASLQPILTTTDTFAIIDRNDHSGSHFTVRPSFTYSKGQPDETVNVTQQGKNCYLNNFLVSLNSNGLIDLTVDLSLPSRIESLRIIRSDKTGSDDLVNINPTLDNYSFTDQDLIPGKTTYQLLLQTTSGLEIVTEEISLFTTDDKKYILFPNPVTDGEIAFLSPVTSAIFQVLDTSGRPLEEFLISAEFEIFPITLSKGVYLYRVIKDGEPVQSGRFVVGSRK